MKNLNHSLEYLNKFPGIFIWEKDIESNFTWVNENFSSIFCGLKDPRDIIGMNDYHLFENKYSSRYQEQDRETISINNSIKILETIPSINTGKKILCVTTKIPKYNNKNVPVGTIGHSIDITNSFIMIGKLLSNTQYKNIENCISKSSTIIGQREFGNIKLTNSE